MPLILYIRLNIYELSHLVRIKFILDNEIFLTNFN
jgi:hypothetical protein